MLSNFQHCTKHACAKLFKFIGQAEQHIFNMIILNLSTKMSYLVTTLNIKKKNFFSQKENELKNYKTIKKQTTLNMTKKWKFDLYLLS